MRLVVTLDIGVEYEANNSGRRYGGTEVIGQLLLRRTRNVDLGLWISFMISEGSKGRLDAPQDQSTISMQGGLTVLKTAYNRGQAPMSKIKAISVRIGQPMKSSINEHHKPRVLLYRNGVVIFTMISLSVCLRMPF